MPSNRTQVPPQPSARPQAPRHLASWYMPGFSDGLGNRLLMFDNTSAPSWELLRLRAEFASTPGFETALRARIDQLAATRHPAFPTVRCVDERASGGGLAIVSSFESGRRLSEALERPRSAGVAAHLVRHITPAVARLHRQGVTHGLLTVDRIVLGPRGRVLIRDHVLGSAIDTLRWSAPRLWVELGVITPPDVVESGSHPKTDVVQMGLLALSVMLGRRVDLSEYPAQIDRIIDRVEKVAGQRNPAVFQPLRSWIERALQLRTPFFESAEDANEALREWGEDTSAEEADFELPSATASTRAELFPEKYVPEGPRRLPQKSLEAQEPGPASAQSADAVPAAPTSAPAPSVASMAQDPTLEFPIEPAPEPFKYLPETPRYQAPLGDAPDMDVATAPPPTRRVARTPWTRSHTSLHLSDDEFETTVTESVDRMPTRRSEARSIQTLRITAAASLLVAIVEGVALLYLLVFRAPVTSTASDTSTIARGSLGDAGAASADPASNRPATSGAQEPRLPGRTDPPATVAAANRARDVVPEPEAAPPPGAVRVSSPIDLQIYEGDRLLGTTRSGAVAVAPGRHRLQLVNQELGYSLRRAVTVAAGQTVSIAVTPGNGSVNINATPWAEVWVDGTSIGVTPLAKVSLPLGEHVFVFRHPQLGERRRTARVRSNNVTSVTVTLGS